MVEERGRQVVVVDPGRWNGLVVELPPQFVPDGVPPSEFVIRARETLPGVEPRERDVRLRHVAEIGSDLFYAPVPGQHAEDPAWPGARRAIVGARPAPPGDLSPGGPPGDGGPARHRAQHGSSGRAPGPSRR